MADVFTEVVVAPAFTDGALGAFAERKGLRVVRAPLPERRRPRRAGAAGRRARPGSRRRAPRARADLEVVSTRQPTEDEWRDLLFAWTVACA